MCGLSNGFKEGAWLPMRSPGSGFYRGRKALPEGVVRLIGAPIIVDGLELGALVVSSNAQR